MAEEFDFEAMFEQVASQPEVVVVNEGLDPSNARFIDPEVIENPNIKRVDNVVTKTMSFNSTKPKVKSNVPQRKFITKEITLDKFNTKRVKVELTPSVCDVCAFDIAAKVYGRYSQAPSSEHEKIAKALAEHKRIVHPLNQSLIVDEDQVPTQWLGQTR